MNEYVPVVEKPEPVQKKKPNYTKIVIGVLVVLIIIASLFIIKTSYERQIQNITLTERNNGAFLLIAQLIQSGPIRVTDGNNSVVCTCQIEPN